MRFSGPHRQALAELIDGLGGVRLDLAPMRPDQAGGWARSNSHVKGHGCRDAAPGTLRGALELQGGIDFEAFHFILRHLLRHLKQSSFRLARCEPWKRLVAWISLGCFLR